MVLQLHEYLMRCLSDIHTSPHQRKCPRIMVQPYISVYMHHTLCDFMLALQLQIVESKAYLQYLFNLKSMKFSILSRHTENVTALVSITSLNYITLYYLCYGDPSTVPLQVHYDNCALTTVFYGTAVAG